MQNAPLNGRVGWATWEYSFAKHGGAVSTIALDPKSLPKGAIVMDGVIHVKTAVTSDGAPTVAFQINSAEDVLAETLKGALTLNLLVDVVPVGTAATMIRCTAAAQVSIVIGVADLTAGVIAVGLRWGMTD